MKSITFEESVQVDGRKYITFRMVDNNDVPRTEIGLYPGDFDASAVLTDMAARWDAMLAAAEINANVSEITGT